MDSTTSSAPSTGLGHSPPPGDEYNTSRGSSASTRRRRPRGIRDLFSRPQDEIQEQPFDVTFLYPDVNPYSDRHSTCSAPDDLEHHHVRSLSQPGSSSFMESTLGIHDTPLTGIPRSPTYPPSTGGQRHGSRRMRDREFEDEEDFHLFAQATAGLGPDQAFRLAYSPPTSTTPQRAARTRLPQLSRPTTSGDRMPSDEGTPTTVYALHQLPQMPEGRRQSQRERLQHSNSNLDLWLQLPSSLVEGTDVSSVDDFDDELPDYAESQARHKRIQEQKQQGEHKNCSDVGS